MQRFHLRRIAVGSLLMVALAGFGGCGQSDGRRVVPLSLANRGTQATTAPGATPAAPSGQTGGGAATTTAPTQAPSLPPLPSGVLRRVVLALDGVPYEVVADMQARGHFRQFNPVSRMVSVFPSLSNPAWATVLGIGQEPGYQTYYFSNNQKKKVGASLADMSNPHWGSRFHIAPDGIFEHAMSYVFTYSTARKVLKETVEKIAQSKGRETIFAYSSHTDALTHSDGRPKLEKLLEELDSFLSDLQSSYQKAHPGYTLEIVLLSDHGNTLKPGGKLVDVEKALEGGGFRVTSELSRTNDVAYTSGGILSSVALHTDPSNESRMAHVVAGMKGCDFTCYDEGGIQYIVAVRGESRLEWSTDGLRARYTVLKGQDPLDLAGTLQRLQARGLLDAQGYADAKDVFEETYDHKYPDPFQRIRTGLSDLVFSPANVLVSLEKGFENANGFVKLMSKLKGRSGTHGALASPDSCGILMSNTTTFAPAVRASDVGKNVDLKPLHEHIGELLLTVNPARSPRAFVNRSFAVSLLFRDSQSSIGSLLGGTVYRIEVRQKRLFVDKVLYSQKVNPPSVLVTADIAEVDLSSVLGKMKPSTKYEVRATIEHMGTGFSKVVKRKFERTADLQIID